MKQLSLFSISLFILVSSLGSTVLAKEEKSASKQSAEALWKTYPLDKKLCTAIKYNRADLVARVVEKENADVNVNNMECQFPLSIAVKKRNLEIVGYLISHGAKMEIESILGIRISVLDMAAKSRKKNVEMIELLISKGANVNGGSDNMISAMLKTADSAKEQETKDQHNMNAEKFVNGGVLNRAISKGHIVNIETLLNHGANPNGFMMASSVLMDAVNSLKIDRVKLLVKHGADVNLRGPGNQTALMRLLQKKTSKRREAKKQKIIDYLKSVGALTS